MKNLFIIDYTYMSAIDEYLSAHVDWLHEQYKKGIFITSGHKIPYNGGIIIAKGDNVNQIYAMLVTDPFIIHRVAWPNIIEFEPSRIFVENMPTNEEDKEEGHE